MYNQKFIVINFFIFTDAKIIFIKDSLNFFMILDYLAVMPFKLQLIEYSVTCCVNFKFANRCTELSMAKEYVP